MMQGIHRYPPMERVIYGVPLAEALAQEIERIGANAVYVLASGTLARQTDVVDRVRGVLGNKLAGVCAKIGAHTPRVDVVAAANAAREARADALLTVGGGSVTDAAKMVGLCLGNDVTGTCATSGAEYNGCPQTVILNHFADNATDPVVEEFGNGPSQVTTELTIVPCSEDFENQVPGAVTVQFLLTNEFEELFSTSTTVTCWGNFKLDRIARIFDISFLGSRFAQTRMSAATDDQPGFVGVAEEFHAQRTPKRTLTSRAALNLHVEGVRVNGDVIILPENQ